MLVGAGAEVWQSACYNHSNGEDFLFGLVDMSFEEATLDSVKARVWVLVKAETQMSCEEVADLLFSYKVVGAEKHEKERKCSGHSKKGKEM